LKKKVVFALEFLKFNTEPELIERALKAATLS